MGILIKLILTGGLIYAGGWCYHRGGDEGGKWARLWVIPVIGIVTFLLWHGLPTAKEWILVVLSYPLQLASLSSYYKKKGADALWWNWLMVGIGFGLSRILFTIITGHWWWFVWQTVLSGYAVMVWSELNARVSPEEGGRGGLFIGGIPWVSFS